MLKCFWANISLLEESEVFEHWLTKVNIQRREKVLRCKNEKDKRRSLLAGVVLRQALEREGFSYEDVVFSVTTEGKPVILSHPQIHFNVSHAGDYICCVISDMPIGVDIESMEKAVFSPEKGNRLDSLAKKCLSAAEWQVFKNSQEQGIVFLEYWTKKEAYSKFTGKGLGIDFATIDTDAMEYWTSWFMDKYCMSIYRKNENYEELSVKQIESL